MSRITTTIAFVIIVGLTGDLALNAHPHTAIPVAREGIADSGTPYGPMEALVTIVKFSDFECIYCAQLASTLDRVKTQYDGKIRIIYRHFPLTEAHPNAWKAAEASLCAGEQEHFWTMHDAMFVNQGALEVANLKAMARRIGMDGKAFDQCLDSDQYYRAVFLDVSEARIANVTGTPTMFINDQAVVGAVPFEELSATIDAMLDQ